MWPAWPSRTVPRSGWWSSGAAARLTIGMVNPGAATRRLTVTPMAHGELYGLWQGEVAPGAAATNARALRQTGGWYDFRVTCDDDPAFARRYAGRLESGEPSVTDPAMAGPALTTWVV